MGKYLSCIAIQITMSVILELVGFLLGVVVVHKLVSILTSSYLWQRNRLQIIFDTYVSRIIDLLLPLLSYLSYRDEKDYPDGGQNQIILVWTVLLEIIRTSLVLPWELWDSIEQVTRILWVMYLVYGQKSLQGLRRDLFILCVIGLVFEFFKTVILLKAKRRSRLSKKTELRAEKLNSACGPNNHLNNQNHSVPDNLLMFGKLFQFSSEDDKAFKLNSQYLCLREISLSFALAKLLRPRFSELPLDEACNRKTLDFVMKDSTGLWQSTEDLPAEESDEQKAQRVFRIIWTELSFLCDILRIEVYAFYNFFGLLIQWLFAVAVVSTCPYIIWATFERRSKWVSSMVDRYQHCANFNEALFSRKTAELSVAIFDTFTTIALVFSCVFYPFWWLWKYYRSNWFTLHIIARDYLNGPTILSKIHTLIFNAQKIRDTPFRTPDTIEHIHLSGNLSWVHVDVQKALLASLKNCNGQLTSGQLSLERHSFEHLKWACQPNKSNTEAILVWHIATSLFDQDNPSDPQHGNRGVAMTLSKYCAFLVSSVPELLPDKVYMTKEVYGKMIEEIPSVKILHRISKRNIVLPIRMRHLHRKQNAEREVVKIIRDGKWNEESVVGKGLRLYYDLKKKEEDNDVLWKMLADFWAEMMLYIAPSDNVNGHRNIIGKRELITQVWALLTHAGITSRPHVPEQHHDLGNNAV